MNQRDDEDMPLPRAVRDAVIRWRTAPPDNPAAKAALLARIRDLPRPVARISRSRASQRAAAAVATIGVAAVLLIAVVLPRTRRAIGDVSPPDAVTPQITPRRTPVVLSVDAARAGHVSVAGDFNGWDSVGVALTRRGTLWSVTLALPAGRYAYAFRVDDHWMPDDTAPRAASDFGGPVSILVVSNQSQP